MGSPTTGVEVLDRLLEGVRVGDNLVLQGDGVPLDGYAEAFATAMGTSVQVVWVAVSERPSRSGSPGIVLDWTGNASSGQEHAQVHRLAEGASAAEARRQLEQVDRDVGTGAAFVFDSLTAIQERWGAEAALDLFLWACPRLYRRESLALWLVDRTRHEPRFLARLQEITQVVLDLSQVDGEVQAEVLAADGRPEGVVGRRVRLQVDEAGNLTAGPIGAARQRLGGMVREQRTARGLAQAELARRIGISPSALSQVERGVRGLSAESLMRIWEALGVPFGPHDTKLRGYRIARRGGPSATGPAPGVTGRRVVDDAEVGQVWDLAFAPGAVGRSPVFDVKAAETVWIRRGVLDIDVGGQRETLQEGDAVVAAHATITGWTNPSSSPTEAVWFIAPHGTLHTST